MVRPMFAWLFGVFVRPRTWLGLIFQVLAFPLGLFYFIFLVTGLSVGLGLVVVWVGIPILLVVAGAWWLFAALERAEAKWLLGAKVPPAPRAWESRPGVWGKLKAHFGSATTWLDLVYLLAKLPFGVISFTLIVTVGGVVTWFLMLPAAWYWHVRLVSTGAGNGWTPPGWLALLGPVLAFLAALVGLHMLNGWGWISARWAELLLGGAAPAPVAAAAPEPLVSTAPAAAPIVSTAPPAPFAPSLPSTSPASPSPPAPVPSPVPTPPPEEKP